MFGFSYFLLMIEAAELRMDDSDDKVFDEKVSAGIQLDGGSEFESQLSLCVLRVWTGRKSAGQNRSEPRRVWRRQGGASLSRSRNT